MQRLTSKSSDSVTRNQRLRFLAAVGSRNRSGQALIEFAVIAFVMTLLLSAMLTFGFMLFGANVLQQAADVGAMELARHPYSPTGTFSDALSDVGGTAPLFLEEFLVCEIGGSDTANEDLPSAYTEAQYQALQNRMPLINRLLFPLYIYDRDLNAIRYPGTVVNHNGDRTVLIPIVGFGNRDANTGIETITQWREVVEEILPNGATQGAYSVTSTTTGELDAGMVALRINFPYQSGALVAYQQQDSGGTVLRGPDALGQNDITNIAVEADDSAVTAAALPTGYTLANPTADNTIDGLPHRGTYGLGSMQAYAMTVRPYRKVLTGQGIYRREVFAP
jgi:hypothetical protein